MTDNTPDARRIIGDFKAADVPPKTVTEEQITELVGLAKLERSAWKLHPELMTFIENLVSDRRSLQEQLDEATRKWQNAERVIECLNEDKRRLESQLADRQSLVKQLAAAKEENELITEGRKSWEKEVERLKLELAAAKRSLEYSVSSSVQKILEERILQTAKWGEQNHDEGTWLKILIEEVGEFSEASLHKQFGGPEADNVRNEAVQVAAVALAIVEYLDRTPATKGWFGQYCKSCR